MTASFARFTHHPSGKPCYVDPVYVTYIGPSPDNDGLTIICSDTDTAVHYVEVSESTEDSHRIVTDALKDDE